MRIEDQVLLYCSRTDLNEEIKKELENLLKQDLNWDYIRKRSDYHGLAPLIYYHLKDINIPENLFDDFKKRYYANIARNTLLFEELSKVLKTFNEEGIDVILLKGAFLAQHVYSNIGLRPMKDLDLLIKEEDLSKAKNLMKKLGYTMDLRGYSESYVEKTVKQWGFFKNTIHIEIHTSLVPETPFYKYIELDLDGYWERAQKKTDFFFLSLEDLLIYSCIHLDLDGEMRLIWFCDICEIINSYNDKIDWNKLLENSIENKVEPQVYFFLSLTKGIYDLSIPENFLFKFSNKYKKPIDFLFQPRIMQRITLNSLRISNLDSINKLRFLFYLVFPPIEELKRMYPHCKSKKIYFYYILHPISKLFKR